MDRKDLRNSRIAELSSGFSKYLDFFDSHGPFSVYQRDCHVHTLKRRFELGSVRAAIDDRLFIESLMNTLAAWRIGIRGTHLVEYVEFGKSLKRHEKAIEELEDMRIEDEKLEIPFIVNKIWQIISSLNVLLNTKDEVVLAPLVSGTKILLHFLPNLVPPMDREYTQTFFGWHNPEFQYGQERFFRLAYESLAGVAREVKPSSFLGDKWRMSSAKLLDSALVGYCVAHNLKKVT